MRNTGLNSNWKLNYLQLNKKCNYSVGLRIYCVDRKKTQWQKAKIPSPQVIFMDFRT